MATKRIIGIDNLRFIMVVFVIGLHSAMTYMDYVPEWWYVINPKKSIGFTYLVIILDSFPMTALFFLSGYFAPFSLAKRGVASFINNKFMHIGLPWILGVILVAPFFSRATMAALGYSTSSIIPFFFHSFFGAFYQQAHYWFLGVLFFFFLVYSCVYKIKFICFKITPILLIGGVIAFTAITYFLSSHYYKPTDGWTNIGYVLYFQPARFVGYFLMFFLGIHAQKSNWFRDNGWMPKLNIFLPLALFSLLGLVIVKMNLFFQFSEVQRLLMDTLFYSLTSVLMSFFLIAVFMKISPSIQKPLTFFTPYSYGIYWLHQIILMFIMYELLDFNILIFFKWFFSVLFTILIATFLTRYVLKKVPLLKEIF